MTDGAAKLLEMQLLDTWSVRPDGGMSIAGAYCTDLDVVSRGGEAIDIPAIAGHTVHKTETAAVEATSLSVTTLTVDELHFVNAGVSFSQYSMLLGGNANYAAQMARSAAGSFIQDVDRSIIKKMIKAVDGDADSFTNLDLADVSQEMISDTVAKLTEQNGIPFNDGIAWLASPKAHANVKGTLNYTPRDQVPSLGHFGLPAIASLDGYPFAEHRLVPGRGAPLSSSVVSCDISSNVATVTFSDDEAAYFPVGMRIYTKDFNVNISAAELASTQVLSNDGTSITFGLTGSDGSNGSGSVVAGCSMALAIAKPWCFYSDTGVPSPQFIKRTDAAGWSVQLTGFSGLKVYPGGVKILCSPLL